MSGKLRKVKKMDLVACFVFVFTLPIGIFLKFINYLRKTPLWLICEVKDMCRDNGYHLFKYVKEQHPEINCYYVLDKKCPDYKKIEKYKDVIQYGSFKHWIYYIAAKWNISTHKEGNPNQAIFTVLHLYLRMFNNRVFLQHGITKDDVPMFYYKNTYFKKIICGAKPEYEYIKEKFGYPKENVVYTGFARFDELHDFKADKKKILIIPTWRRWFELYKSSDKDKFIQSEYYKKWLAVINDERLIKFAEENDVEVLFYSHYQMQKFIDEFYTKSNKIKVVSFEQADIQKILKEAGLMITDYSSVYMDFAYMNKPVIYYQFDYDEYRKSHLKKGYFEYHKNGFGKVIKDKNTLIEEILKKYYDGCKMDKKYQDRAKKFFILNDNKNCERIFNELK